MNPAATTYIWQAPDWPQWRYDLAALTGPLTDVSLAQGLLLGRLADVGMALRDQASLAALTEDVLKTSEIEGEILNAQSVRSSIARRMGVDIGALAPVDRHVEGVVEMMLDATTRATAPLTAQRLLGWHAALFPTGYSGLHQIEVGQWRTDAQGPMQVVSGPVQNLGASGQEAVWDGLQGAKRSHSRGYGEALQRSRAPKSAFFARREEILNRLSVPPGRRKVHFQAPPAQALAAEIERFLAWANAETGEPALIKAGLAHLWFVTLHPFDDGNGRIARAVGDLFLARADGSAQRFYSLSAQIQRERKDYYEALEQTQKGSLDVTGWLSWFLGALGRAVASAQDTLDAVLRKARFWQRWAEQPMNERQLKLLNRLLDGFDGKLTSSKWATIAKCSPDTALRDITQLLELGALRKTPGGGRSTGYELAAQ